MVIKVYDQSLISEARSTHNHKILFSIFKIIEIVKENLMFIVDLCKQKLSYVIVFNLFKLTHFRRCLFEILEIVGEKQGSNYDILSYVVMCVR